MRRFLIVWAGQLVSVLGTSLTAFGLGVWVFQETGSVTLLSLIVLVITVPATVISPFAGAIVDRTDRRRVMLLADAVAGAATLGLAVLFLTGDLDVWHIYVLVGAGSVANAFQVPAWLSSIPLIVPKSQLGRTSGMVQLNDAVGTLVAPVVAGALLVTSGLGAILVIDAVTFLVGIATLSVVRFPLPPAIEEKAGAVRKEVAEGWQYLRRRPGLLGLLVSYAAVNFAMGFVNVLYLPLLLAFATEAGAGLAISVAGTGMVVGSLAMSVWGGPRRRVRAVFTGIAGAGLAIAVMGLRPSLPLVASAGFAMLTIVAVTNASSQVIWQTKVAPDVQGRVFAMRRTLSGAVAPVAYLLAGPLADGVFEPLMAESGLLADTVGQVIGSGTGRGVGLMFVVVGVAAVVAAAVAYGVPAIRNLEDEIPDALPDLVPAG